MKELQKGKQNRRKWIGLALVLLILGTAAGAGIYVSDYYHAQGSAYEAMESDAQVAVTAAGDRIVFEPAEIKAGLIFYPGGKVQFEAYAPLMRAFAENGVLCVLLRMPGNLAVLDMNAAEGVKEEFPSVTNWYLGGHSLGGSMAASYVAKHSADYEGLLLLAAYSTADLSDSGLKIFSIYGSEDQVLNRESYEKNRSNLPKDVIEEVLVGGCHAFFGAYGNQEGDGVPTLTREEQIRQTAKIFSKAVATVS